LVTNGNRRGRGPAAFPTLGDLYVKIDQVARSLGYDRSVNADVAAALRTRVDSLRVGAKGSMLDAQATTDFNIILGRPTVVELDGMGNGDEKAFLIGLFLIRLAEQQILAGPTGGQLRHVTVIEEAHRLFLNVPLVNGGEVGNCKAVDSFCKILSR